MVDKTEISKPIEIKDNSVERVALDLMEIIASVERTRSDNYLKPNTREYFLKLYNQCHRVVGYSSIDVDQVLQD
jgi:hypothetical protein